MQKAIKVYKQGNLDGLCGLYSLINAYKLITTRTHRKFYACSLFRRSIKHIGKERILEVLEQGINVNLLLNMNKQIFQKKYPKVQLKRPFLRKKVGIEEKMKEISSILFHRKGVIIIGLYNKYINHWTVICAENEYAYILADSDSLRLLKKQSFLGEKPYYNLDEVLVVLDCYA